MHPVRCGHFVASPGPFPRSDKSLRACLAVCQCRDALGFWGGWKAGASVTSPRVLAECSKELGPPAPASCSPKARRRNGDVIAEVTAVGINSRACWGHHHLVLGLMRLFRTISTVRNKQIPCIDPHYDELRFAPLINGSAADFVNILSDLLPRPDRKSVV